MRRDQLCAVCRAPSYGPLCRPHSNQAVAAKRKASRPPALVIRRPEPPREYPAESWWTRPQFYETAHEAAERLKRGTGVSYEPTQQDW